MSALLKNKVAIVTGGSRGIGAAIVKNLASKGANVMINYSSDSSASLAESLSQSLQPKYGVKIISVKADVGSQKGVETMIAAAKDAFAKDGKLQIDILINNAGICINDNIEDVKIDDFHELYRVNVLGPLLVMQGVQPYLPNDRSGRVVNTSSVSSTLGFKGQTLYGGSKAAVEAMTRSWARELSERCTVNAVNPGPVLTRMYSNSSSSFFQKMKPFQEHAPLSAPRPGIDSDELINSEVCTGGRPAYPEDIAGIIAMLCLPDAGWSTGQVISANGGMIFGTQ